MFVITNRNRRQGGKYGGKPSGLSFLVSGEKLTGKQFRARILEEFAGDHEQPPRLVGFVHGFNVSWKESLETFSRFDKSVTQQLDCAAITVGFSWPSDGKVTSYLDDRADAEASSVFLAAVIARSIEFVLTIQCPAQICLVAHSMGNYVLAKAAKRVWEYRGKPKHANIFKEILMVAPDLDAECLEKGRKGSYIPKISRRVHVFSSRADSALALSSSKRLGVTGKRLGRSGPANPSEVAANVVHLDATEQTKRVEGVSEHSAHFHDPAILEDMRQTLMSKDRREIDGRVRTGNGFKIRSNAA